MRLATTSRSAGDEYESPTIVGDLPPSSRQTGVKCSAAAFITILPTRGDPVKKILSHLSATE